MQGNKNKNTVFVGNVPFDVKEETIRAIFGLIGPVKDYWSVNDRETGQPKGFGFCEYGSEVEAIAAINSLDQQEINGRRIRVDSAHGSKAGDAMAQDEYSAQRISPEIKKEIDNALRSLTMSELHGIVSEMKALIQRDRDHACKLLESKPVLAQALLTAQLMLGMAQISAGAATTASSAAAQPIQDMANPEETAELLKSFMTLSDEDIAKLEPEEREQVLKVRALAAASAQQQ